MTGPLDARAALLIGDAPTGELHEGKEPMNETTVDVVTVGEYLVPVDPIDTLECDSCQ